ATVSRMLDRPAYGEAAGRLAKVFAGYDAPGRFREVLSAFPPRPSGERGAKPVCWASVGLFARMPSLVTPGADDRLRSHRNPKRGERHDGLRERAGLPH